MSSKIIRMLAQLCKYCNMYLYWLSLMLSICTVPYTQYTVEVRAKTIVGTGAPSRVFGHTKKTG